MRQLLLIVLAVGLVACEEASEPAAPAPALEISEAAMAQFSRSCVLCHVDGNAGAPRIGNAQEWLSRLEQGPDVLLAHTIDGFNAMPPLGYCMSCEREDFEAMISLMTEGL